MGQIATAPVTVQNPYRSTVAQLDDIFRLAENTTVHFLGSALRGYGAASIGNWIPTFRAHPALYKPVRIYTCNLQIRMFIYTQKT